MMTRIITRVKLGDGYGGVTVDLLGTFYSSHGFLCITFGGLLHDSFLHFVGGHLRGVFNMVVAASRELIMVEFNSSGGILGVYSIWWFVAVKGSSRTGKRYHFARVSISALWHMTAMVVVIAMVFSS